MKMRSIQPGQTVTLSEQNESAGLADDILPKTGSNKFTPQMVGTVLETRTFVRVIVGTTVGWIDETKIKMA
ncbi:MAG: hypothetical protein EBR82_00075 [Caulobacteraceae bacterium]|jgi:hypothetical protein|nr:hypothetical protein [Caulobacteraceae bacterium]